MYIKEITVENYKGFNEAQHASWEPGFNILVGKNNAGKSSLIDEAELVFTQIPHVSLTTRPDPAIPLTKPSVVDIVFSVSRQELLIYLRRLGGVQFQIPCPPVGSDIMNRLGISVLNNDGLQKAVDWIFGQDHFNFHLRRAAGSVNQVANWVPSRNQSLSIFELPPGNVTLAVCVVRQDGTTQVVGSTGFSGPVADFGLQLGEAYRTDVYRFSAERFSLGRSSIGTNRLLSKNASNLPEVLNNLNATPAKLEEFKGRVRDILPDVKVFTTRVIDQQNVEVMAWIADPSTGRDDLAVSLGNCGTGTAQVLALLYAAIMAPRPSVILLDEPQTFLHPGATRKLLQALRSYSQHQYILATHSTTVVSASSPATITVARLENGETKLEQLSANENIAQQTCLSELGTRLSDVFGADQILWVEGPTEDQCFPLILEKVARKQLPGIEIVPLRNTGDMEGRSAEMVIDIYNRISQGHSLIPPAVAIVFDRECRDEQSQKQLIRKSGGLAKFLPRRMFENYLINARAIASVTSSLDNFRREGVKAEDVEAIIDSEKVKPSNYCSAEAQKNTKNWMEDIHGAKLLNTIFKTLSENRYEYRKIEHGLLLTKAIIEIEPTFLSGLANFLRQLLSEPESRVRRVAQPS